MNNRSTIIALRSTTNATSRPAIAPSSAPTPRNHQIITPATTVTTATSTNNDEKMKQNSTKSVFPLFFDVL
jgi:hypothetical protein